MGRKHNPIRQLKFLRELTLGYIRQMACFSSMNLKLLYRNSFKIFKNNLGLFFYRTSDYIYLEKCTASEYLKCFLDKW